MANRERVRKWREKNADRARAASRAWKRANPARVAACAANYERPPTAPDKALEYTHNYRAKHPEQYRAALKRWAEENPHRRRASKALRRALECCARPAWANPQRIAEIYREAELRSRQSGAEHHVDHIVPLNHPKVCGLHCEANLQVLVASENLRKGNRFEVGRDS